jgi:hypothetical protein
MLAIAAAIVLAAIILFSPKFDIAQVGQSEQTQKPSEISDVYGCKSNTECFLASCKITPSEVECVNVSEQEIYYQNCQAYWDIDIVQDFVRCACVQDVCTLIK